MVWILAVATNLLIGATAYVLAWQIAHDLFRDRQWPRNRLALAMLAIVGTCSAGHFEHGLHLLFAPGARYLWPPEVIGLDLIMATGIVVYLYCQNGSLSKFARGAALFEDTSVRTGNALQMHNQVVERLAGARYAIERGDYLEARTLVDQSLASAREVITDLLPPDDDRMPGSVRRDRPAPIGRSVA